jgi:ABC-type proline/glycine betaine transport system ATPase subunit
MISLRNIEKHYDGVQALRHVNLDIADGELVVLIGPSGCGKSTLLRTVNRMTEPSAGQIIIDGRNALESDPVLLRRSIGYVIQNVGLFPHMTVRENVAVVPQLLGWDKAKRLRRADEMLELVRLDPERFGSRYPGLLSGGQQQRVRSHARWRPIRSAAHGRTFQRGRSDHPRAAAGRTAAHSARCAKPSSSSPTISMKRYALAIKSA